MIMLLFLVFLCIYPRNGSHQSQSLLLSSTYATSIQFAFGFIRSFDVDLQ